jgi:hydroxylaminobenzene mutase
MDVRIRARQILVHALAMVLFGLVWGLVVPHTPFPRLALGAHIQFMTNGILFIVMALVLLSTVNNVGPRSASIMLLAVILTWVMGFSEIANAWWGTHEVLPIAAQQAGATGATAWQEAVVTLAHVAAGLVLIVAWALLIKGFLEEPTM